MEWLIDQKTHKSNFKRK